MSTLLVIAIGPVQEFIAAARTTRDLWFGSELLSQIGRRIARTLSDGGAALIFPHPDSLNDPAASVPNRIFAEVSREDAAMLVERARQAAVVELHGWRTRVAHDYPSLADVVDWDAMDHQIDGFLEFYAAWGPFDAQAAATYGEQRARVERLLAGRKALRDFALPDGEPGRPKSSLDPSRDSVLLSQALHTKELGWRIRQNEQLDALSLIRRLAAKESFPAASRVALDPFIRRAKKDSPRFADLTMRAESLVDSGEVTRLNPSRRCPHYAAFPYNTTLIYDEGRPDAPDPGDKVKTQARQFFNTANEIRRELAIASFPDYFAILVADGDHMGRLIGELADPDEHRRLSAGLAKFAREAATIVGDQHGALVYAGGDDVLAFLPLDTALECANDLRLAFEQIAGAAAGGRPVSLSAGLAIVHAVEHLQHALDWARQAEQHAKLTRNSLAVAFHPRSGGGHALTVSHGWTADPPAPDRWRRWVDAFRTGALSAGALYELRGLGRELRGHDPEVVKAVLNVEAERILRRKQQRDGTPVADDTVRQALKEIGENVASLEATVNELSIARRIAQAAAVSRPAPVAAEAVAG